MKEKTLRYPGHIEKMRVLRESGFFSQDEICLLYTSDAADERSSVDLGGRRIIKKKTNIDLASVGNRHKTIHIPRT